MGTLIIGKRLYEFSEAGSMGIVTDTTYINCYWPRLTDYTAIFADGSSNIKIMGFTAPRYVTFPENTEFVDYSPDALNATISKSTLEGRVCPIKFEAIYAEEVAKLLPTDTIFSTSNGDASIVVDEVEGS